jgi:hypothetical protein
VGSNGLLLDGCWKSANARAGRKGAKDMPLMAFLRQWGEVARGEVLNGALALRGGLGLHPSVHSVAAAPPTMPIPSTDSEGDG